MMIRSRLWSIKGVIMKKMDSLKSILDRIDGRGYKAYKDIQGEYDFGWYVLHIDNVQSDPFAPPSRMRLTVRQDKAGFPAELFNNRIRKVALEDYLTRCFIRATWLKGGQEKTTGKSGLIKIDRCGQEILERTSMVVTEKYLQARFVIGLPARGRSILARKAESIFFEELPSIINKSMIFKNLNSQFIKEHIALCEDQEFLRDQLKEKKLVAFVGDGSILPRESGISDKPLTGQKVFKFKSPPELKINFRLPHQGQITGMGIPEGVTLIVGGGYHGKSTLLKALERGVYNHIPGDGREWVVSLNSAVKIRSEDGRSVAGVDISPFISDLPNKEDTSSFSSVNASGSTSQAANIVEALESDSQVLLLDEDTSATNFMIRDGRMQHLVAKENEPITPFIDRVQELKTILGVSTIVVLGGSGDYFDVADRIIMLKDYQAYEVTTQAKKVASIYQNERTEERKIPLQNVCQRIPLPESFQLRDRDKIKTKGLNKVLFAKESVDLFFVEQLVDESQTRAIAEIFRFLANDKKNSEPLKLRIDWILEKIQDQGLEFLSSFQGKHPGDMALPRKQDILAAINRFRKLKVSQQRKTATHRKY